MSRINYEKVNRQERVTFVPSPRSEPATQAQLDHILSLYHQKGKRPPTSLPKTKQGASDLIDRLKHLPNVNTYERVRIALGTEDRNDYQEMLIEWQQHLNLSPMTIRSLVHVLWQVDPISVGFFFEELLQEELPTGQDELLLYILRRFVTEFADVND